MSRSRDQLEINDRHFAARLFHRPFSDGRKRRGPEPILGRALSSRHFPARRPHHFAEASRKPSARDVFEVRVDHDFDGRHGRLRRRQRRSRENLDQRPHPAAISGSFSTWARPYSRDLARRRSRRRPLRRPDRRGVLWREHVSPQDGRFESGAGCIWRRGFGSAVSACSTRNSSRRISPLSARSKCRRKSIGAASRRRWRAG